MIENHQDFIAVNERFPHIGKKLKDSWGKPLFVRIMDELRHDTRGGTRTGFPLDALMCLHSINEHHRRHFPDLYPKDIWDNH